MPKQKGNRGKRNEVSVCRPSSMMNTPRDHHYYILVNCVSNAAAGLTEQAIRSLENVQRVGRL